MKRNFLAVPFLVAALALPASAQVGQGTDRASATQLREGMRKLWEDHVTYTAFFYTAVIHGGDDAGKLAERLLRNQDDIGNAVKAAKAGDAAGAISAYDRGNAHMLALADALSSGIVKQFPGRFGP